MTPPGKYRPPKATQQTVGAERVTNAQLDALIALAENADGMWSDESSRIALAGWRELKAMRSLLAASKWQPIESAPKDGIHVLVADFSPNSDGFGRFDGKIVPFQAVAHYWSNLDEEGFYLSSGSQDSPLMRLTHWQPLCSITSSHGSAETGGRRRSALFPTHLETCYSPSCSGCARDSALAERTGEGML